MGDRVLKAGDVGIDYAFTPSVSGKPVTMQTVAMEGAKFICRYSAGTASSLPKVCGTTEISDAAAYSVDFFGNFELAEDTPTQGAAAGKAHGTADNDFWHSVGLAPHAGVIVSWEPGNDVSKYPVVARFLEEYHTAVGRPIGLYAGLPALLHFRDLGLIDFTWLPMASSASNLNFGNITQAQYAAQLEQVAKDNGINLCQNRNRWFTSGADENVLITLPSIPFSHMQALRGSVGPKPLPKPPVPPPTPVPPPSPVPTPNPVPTPTPTPTPVPTPPVEDTDMPLILKVNQKDYPQGKGWPGWFLLSGSKYAHIPSTADADALTKAGVKSVNISKAMHDNLSKA